MFFLLSSHSLLIGTNRSDDVHNIKVNLKNDSAIDDKTKIGVHLNDEVLTQENGHSNEQVESNQSVSILLVYRLFLLLLLLLLF